MPRKTANRTQKAEPMPFQTKYDKSNFEPMFYKSGSEAAKAALPIFGGTAPDGATETKTDDSSSDTKTTKATTDSSGGDTSPEITPEQFAQLTQQVASLTSTNTQLQNQLQSFTSKEDEARRASQGREETLAEDLSKAQQTIDAMDQIIKRQAVINAIQSNKDLQFHNVDDVVSKLAPESYELNVDLESRTATVKGIENEVNRIAKDYDYLVVKPTVENNSASTKPQRRSTGAPPGPQPTNASKSQRRSELEAKWPVIAAGRAKLG
jgi:DNA repair exonuclease SbcCD ATPase subunit